MLSRRLVNDSDISVAAQTKRVETLSTGSDNSDLVCCCMLFDGLLHAKLEGGRGSRGSSVNTLYTRIIRNKENDNQQKILNNLIEIMTNFFINITDKSFDSNNHYFQ